MDQRAALLRTPSPVTPGKGVICRDSQWDIHWDGWVSSRPWVRGNYSISCGPGTSQAGGHTPLKEGRRRGSRSGMSRPRPSPRASSSTTALPPPANVYGVRYQVESPQLPTSPPQGQVRTLCLLLVPPSGRSRCSLHGPGGSSGTRRSPD